MGLLDNVGLAKPLGVAALALLAYRATQGGNTQAGNTANTGGGLLSGILGGGSQSPTGGGLLSRLLGGGQTMSASEVARTVPDGLHGLTQQFQKAGYGDAVNSWIGTGPNQPIAPNQVHQALGQDTIDELSRGSGIPHNDLLSQLSQALPAFVDRVTPNGRIPNQAEMARWQSGEPLRA